MVVATLHCLRRITGRAQEGATATVDCSTSTALPTPRSSRSFGCVGVVALGAGCGRCRFPAKKAEGGGRCASERETPCPSLCPPLLVQNEWIDNR